MREMISSTGDELTHSPAVLTVSEVKVLVLKLRCWLEVMN